MGSEKEADWEAGVVEKEVVDWEAWVAEKEVAD